MQSFIKNLVLFCLFAIPFLVLYVASGHSLDLIGEKDLGLYFPFISGKNIVFRLLVEIAFFGWIILLLKDSKYRIHFKNSPILIAYSAFIVIIFIADLFGVDKMNSFFSNFERMEGFFGHIHFFLYFLVLLGVINTFELWKKMFRYILASNILVLIYAYCQLLGAKGYIFANNFPRVAEWFSSKFPIHMSENRLDATIGNSAYFAIFCLMSAGIAGILWLHSNYERKNIFYPALIVLNLIALFYSGTRGTMIGLIVGLIISFALVAFYEKGKIRRNFLYGLIAIIISVSSIFVFKNTNFVQSSPTLKRLASISLSDLTTMSRLSIWQISYEAWKEKPVLGYGQDNFSYVFARKFIPEKMWNLEPWYDRSHNVFFDWLIAGGALGLISYLSLYFVAIYLVWFKKSSVTVREKALITGIFSAYFVHNIFVFDNLTSYIMFFALLAYIVTITKENKVSNGSKVSDDIMNSFYIPVIGILFVVTAYFMVYKPIYVNKSLVHGMGLNKLTQSMTLEEAIKVSQKSFEDAINAKSVGLDESREQYLQAGIRLAQLKIPETVSQEEKTKIVQAINNFVGKVREDASLSYEMYKDDIRMLSLLGMFYNGTGDSIKAEEVLSRAHSIAPNKQLIAFDLVKAYIMNNKLNEAYNLAYETYKKEIAYGDAEKWYLIASAYSKKFLDARDVVLKDKGELPVDSDVLSSLVSTGQSALAIVMLNDLKKSNPEYASQIDSYIKDILAQSKK